MSGAAPTPGLLERLPVIAFVAIAVGLLLDRYVPLGWRLPEDLRFALTLSSALIAAALAISAVIAFRRANVSVASGTPPRLVTDGVFARTRHPMYLSIILGLFALTINFGSDWMLATSLAATLMLHFRFTLPEERLLGAEFGKEYRRYIARVPRYGWRF